MGGCLSRTHRFTFFFVCRSATLTNLRYAKSTEGKFPIKPFIEEKRDYQCVCSADKSCQQIVSCIFQLRCVPGESVVNRRSVDYRVDVISSFVV